MNIQHGAGFTHAVCKFADDSIYQNYFLAALTNRPNDRNMHQ